MTKHIKTSTKSTLSFLRMKRCFTVAPPMNAKNHKMWTLHLAGKGEVSAECRHKNVSVVGCSSAPSICATLAWFSSSVASKLMTLIIAMSYWCRSAAMMSSIVPLLVMFIRFLAVQCAITPCTSESDDRPPAELRDPKFKHSELSWPSNVVLDRSETRKSRYR